ncbi:Hypothetical predicted protein [Cloeon dipterum]|uniref:Uncharacterized protein n=1 Tax=Cloeon dipterum TaxID=197152 RepID=A0A8S1D8N5_9INSE|nr:Hypothetical predicted protein [Cloeon dipterum]
MDRQRCAVCNENHILTTICLFHALERERERMWQNPLQVDPSAEEPPPQPWEGNAYETGLSFQGSQAAARSLPEQPFGLGALNQQGQEEARKTYHSLQVVNRDNFSGHLGFNSSPSQNAFPSISNSGENIAGFLQNRFPQSNGTNSHLVQPQANLPQSSPVQNECPSSRAQRSFHPIIWLQSLLLKRFQEVHLQQRTGLKHVWVSRNTSAHIVQINTKF